MILKLLPTQLIGVLIELWWPKKNKCHSHFVVLHIWFVSTHLPLTKLNFT